MGSSRFVKFMIRTALSVSALVMTSVPSQSQTIHKVPDDFPDLLMALANAAAGDEIWVSGAGSPYVLTTAISLVDGVNIRGGYDDIFTNQNPARTRIHLAADSTGSIVDASALGAGTLFTHFTVGPPAKPLTFTTVNGAGMFIGAGSPTVSNCIFENNVSRDAGGAIQIGAGSAALIQDCEFRDNETGLVAGGGRGGAIAVAASADAVVIRLCKFERNVSDRLTITTSASGGAIFTRSGIALERCTFRDNYCGFRGGALYVRDGSIRAWGNLFYADSSGADGGAIYHENGDGAHQSSLIEDCVAGVGGGGNGGAAYFLGGSNRFVDGFVRGCEALNGDGFTQGVGGGFYFFQPLQGSAVRGSELSGNRAQAGGAIGVQGNLSAAFSDVLIESNTIVGNFVQIATSARYTGAGIHIFDNFIGTVLNNIITEQEDGSGISCEGLSASPNIRFNCVWNTGTNTDPEYGGSCVDRTNINGNIRMNPVFCCLISGCLPVGTPAPDFQLGAGSPCLGAGEGGVDLGAYAGQSGCLTPVSLQEATWGAIKARYR
ncbi:MAG: right-handed parallel beta-helix repeat-containing protein [Planctomycetota bacterium]|jgi:predicted outer membrane repeat protein